MLKVCPPRNWYYPETFILPADFDLYQKVHAENKTRIYISKISNSSQGAGIRILTKPTELQQYNTIKVYDNAIVQRYMENPLLIDGLKHDLRLYIFIANVDPLIAYLNTEGLARFCTQQYVPPTSTAKIDLNSQLTNYAVNKHSDQFILTDELADANVGSKRTLESYWKSLTAAGYDQESIKSEISKLCQCLMKTLQPYLKYHLKCKYPKGHECSRHMHLLGVDVLLDKEGKPWLLELNSMPSMAVEYVPENNQDKPTTANDKENLEKTQYCKTKISAVDFYVKTKYVFFDSELSGTQ